MSALLRKRASALAEHLVVSAWSVAYGAKASAILWSLVKMRHFLVKTLRPPSNHMLINGRRCNVSESAV